MPQVRWLLIATMTLAGLLAACGEQPGSPLASPTPSVPHDPALQPEAVAGLQATGPLPEYHLALTLDSQAGQLAGRAQIVVPNRSGVPLDEIVFRLYPNLPQYGGRLTIGRAWADGRRTPTQLRAGDTALAVPLSRPLAPDASLLISLTFDVEIPTIEGGYALFSHSQGVWSVPDAYPLLAVHDGTRWHEDVAPAHGDAVFAAAARYDVSLALPPDLVLATTGTIVSQTVQADGSRLYWISGDGLREFAWFASPDYTMVETTAGSTRLRSYYLDGDEMQGRAALSVGAQALGIYGEHFGPYPFSEMVVVEGPLSYYGMEYPGLTVIGLDLYRTQLDEFEFRLAHEIAHQWWYAQVGSDQVNTPWLDEGLAEYSTAVYYEQAYGPERADTLVNQRWQLPYAVAIDTGLDAIVNQPASAFGPNYEVIVYGKAALFFHAMRQQIGDDGFFAILHAYADRYRWRIATPGDLLDVAQSVSGQNLDTLYAPWILQEAR